MTVDNNNRQDVLHIITATEGEISSPNFEEQYINKKGIETVYYEYYIYLPDKLATMTNNSNLTIAVDLHMDIKKDEVDAGYVLFLPPGVYDSEYSEDQEKSILINSATAKLTIQLTCVTSYMPSAKISLI